MQIKEERGQIKLIRYVYMPEKKRTVNRQIGKFASYKDEPPEDLVAQLDDGEKAELEAFMEDKRARQAAFRKRGAVRDLPNALSNAVEAIRDEDGEADALLASPAYIEQLLDGLDDLKKELRKAGIKITRGPKSQGKKSAKEEDQPGLGFGD